ncbi:hypothetical protein ABIC37_005170 [Priestia megaterium]|uniref:hypothetical protein n=1 Tax=Priestia megaterium TaxID=1404 RepID=UPI003399700B
MELEDIFPIFQSYMTSEKIKGITSEQISDTYELLYQHYMDYVNKLDNKSNNIDDYFSWTSKKLDINIVYFEKDNQVKCIFFLSKSEKKGTIVLHDFIGHNISYDILSLNVKPFVSALIQTGKLDLNPDTIISVSFFPEGHVLRDLGRFFFEWEYQYNWKPQLKTAFEKMSFNTLKIHKEIYEFEEMTKIINNEQFTLELEECIDAYEKEKFFVCAAGLGSVLEHLLYLAIEKHVPEKEINTHENSTASEYIGQLRKPPFNISKRDASHLKNVFAYRNSVSHFNKGVFSKEMCDHLLSGIKSAFDKHYLFDSK